MIFVTVGTQLPFPRLMHHMQQLSRTGLEDIVAQTGEDTIYQGMETHRALSAPDFQALATQARVIVAHAGIGTVLAAQKIGRPLIIMPRRAALQEHRNDHQMATATEMQGKRGLRVAWEVGEIDGFLNGEMEQPDNAPSESYATLLDTIRCFVAA